MEGKTFWSTKYDSYEEHGSNVTIEKDETSTMGGNIFQAQNETWAFSKNKIAIEQDKVYKFKIRIRQIQDPLSGADKAKIYAGATAYDALGNKISGANGSYFIVSGKLLTVSEGWIEITTYMSTKARGELIGVDKEVLCPAVKAFDTGTKSIKPMFLVNYQQGDGIAQVDYLTVEDYTQEWNALNLLKDKLNNDSQEVFDALTDNGRIQGIYIQDGQLYVNGQYINARNLRVIDKDDTLTLGIDEDGNVTLRATTLEIGGKTAASQDDVKTSIDNIQIGSRNLLLNADFSKTYENNETGKNDNLYATHWGGYNSGIESPETSYHAHIDSDTFEFNVYEFNESDGSRNWKGISQILNDRLTEVSDNYILSVDVYSTLKGSKLYGGFFYTKTNEQEATFGSGMFEINENDIPVNTWTRMNIKVPLNKDVDFSKTIQLYIYGYNFSSNSIIYIKNVKLEAGNKSTDFSLAPEDIDESKIDVGGAIADVNNSEGQIQYPKLNIKGMIRFTDFDENLAKNYVVKRNEEGEVIETTINGGRLETGSVKADKVELYNLSVIRRRKRPHNESDIDCDIVDEHVHWEELDTSFQINDEGNVKASGTFSSFNFNDVTKDQGWQISENGDSVFNNTLIRGTVELPKAGMTNFDKDNLIPYTNFATDMSKHYSVWDKTSNTKIKWYDSEGGYLQCYNTTLETADGGVGLITPKITGGIFANKKYTLSFKARSENNTGNLDYIFIMSNVEGEANERITANIKINSYKSWEKTQVLTFTSKKDYPNASILIGFTDAIVTENTNPKGFAIKEIMLVEGETPSMWYESSPVRIWSGASFDNRNNAPFQVLQDGSVKATKGEFGGTFTGKLEIGNIKIYDTNSSPGVIEIKDNEDRNTIVKIAENESYFASPLTFGRINNNSFKGYIKYNTNTNSLNMLKDSSIDFGTTSNKKLLIKHDNSKGAYMKFGDDVLIDGEANNLRIYSEHSNSINISIGNFKGNDTIDDASLLIDGNLQTTSLNIGKVKIYETPEKDGIDFFID